MIKRPLDMLNAAKGKKILVSLKNNKTLSGELVAFDIYINLVLENAKELENDKVIRSLGLTFIRGDTILHISQ